MSSAAAVSQVSSVSIHHPSHQPTAAFANSTAPRVAASLHFAFGVTTAHTAKVGVLALAQLLCFCVVLLALQFACSCCQRHNQPLMGRVGFVIWEVRGAGNPQCCAAAVCRADRLFATHGALCNRLGMASRNQSHPATHHNTAFASLSAAGVRGYLDLHACARDVSAAAALQGFSLSQWLSARVVPVQQAVATSWCGGLTQCW